jgi:hypothetical protein
MKEIYSELNLEYAHKTIDASKTKPDHVLQEAL